MWNLCLHIPKTAILKLFGFTERPWGLIKTTWSKNNYAVWIYLRRDCQVLNNNPQESRLKADSHIACRAAKGLEYVFPIWFTQCGRVWFTLAMPCPCRALTMPFFSRPQHSTVIERRPVGHLPAFVFFRLPRGVPRRLLSEAYQSQMQVDSVKPNNVCHGRVNVVAAHNKKDDLLNCWTSSSGISG